MNVIRENIITNGIVPILSLEGSKCLIDEYVSAIIEKRGYNTRKIELSDYKCPSDSSSTITKDELNEYTFRIVVSLINKMRKLSDLNGDRTTYDKLPVSYKDNYSYEEFMKIINLSEEEIAFEVRNYNGGNANFLSKLIANSILIEDRIGKVDAVPYGNNTPHKKDADYRIYINTPNGNDRFNFLEAFIMKCIDKGIPYEMKGEEHTGNEKDRTCIYCFDEYFDETIQVLEEIKKDNPELISNIGSPIATGLNYSYYAITTSRQGATYNYWFNRISSHAINYLFANLIKSDIKYYSSLSDEEKGEIEVISNIHSYLFDSEGRFSGASNKIVNDYILKNREKVMKVETYQQLIESLEIMCSTANFRDFEHKAFPISLDSEFYKQPELSFQATKEVKEDKSIEKELYLYHTEDFIYKVLDLYQQGDFSFDQLMDNYLKRIELIYKNYRYYAMREPGFITSSRNEEITAIFRKIYTGYNKPESESKIDMLEYYQSVQNGVNKYLNEKIIGQSLSDSTERRNKVI